MKKEDVEKWIETGSEIVALFSSGAGLVTGAFTVIEEIAHLFGKVKHEIAEGDEITPENLAAKMKAIDDLQPKDD